MFKKDLKRACRQIPLCPGDMHIVRVQWEDAIFADRVLHMGFRSSSQICQRVTSTVVLVYFNMGCMAVNYLDEFDGAEVLDRAIEAYRILQELLLSCGLDQSKEKCVELTTKMIVLGVLFDSEKITLEVTVEIILEISLLVESWFRKKNVFLTELQS